MKGSLVLVCYLVQLTERFFITHYRKTGDKIAMMEAKLRQMESTNPKPKPTTTPPDFDMDDRPPSRSRPSTPVSSSSLPYNPSLPMKPPPQLPAANSTTQIIPKSKTLMALPSLPMPPMAQGPSGRGSEGQSSTKVPILKGALNGPSSIPSGSGTHTRSAKSSKLVGVKIKPKEKGA